MPTVRVPLRITLAGGGTDLPEYCEENGATVVSATIDKYMTVTVRPGDRITTKKRLDKETGCLVPNDQHPYALAAGWTERDWIQIESDVPEGSGLGGSGALMVALVKARHPDISDHMLASAAFCFERLHLDKPVGWQDHYVAAFGGTCCFNYRKGSMYVTRLHLPSNFIDQLVLFHTNITRDAGPILRSQAVQVGPALSQIHDLANRILYNLRIGGDCFGKYLHEGWLLKKQTSHATTTDQIDEWYDIAKQNGATGGKCCGAGGGGYMLFHCPHNQQRLIDVMTSHGLTHTPFRFANDKAETICS